MILFITDNDTESIVENLPPRKYLSKNFIAKGTNYSLLHILVKNRKIGKYSNSFDEASTNLMPKGSKESKRKDYRPLSLKPINDSLDQYAMK